MGCINALSTFKRHFINILELGKKLDFLLKKTNRYTVDKHRC